MTVTLNSIPQASELGAQLGVRAPKRRLLRATRSGAPVQLAPRALGAFASDELCVAKAGLVVGVQGGG